MADISQTFDFTILAGEKHSANTKLGNGSLAALTRTNIPSHPLKIAISRLSLLHSGNIHSGSLKDIDIDAPQSIVDGVCLRMEINAIRIPPKLLLERMRLVSIDSKRYHIILVDNGGCNSSRTDRLNVYRQLAKHVDKLVITLGHSETSSPNFLRASRRDRERELTKSLKSLTSASLASTSHGNSQYAPPSSRLKRASFG